MKATPCPDPLVAARDAALRLLARREHSKLELQQKLQLRDHDSSVIVEVIDSLAAEGLQSDQRFAEAFVRARLQRLQGPMKIQADLRRRGLSKVIVDSTLAPLQDEWVELARECIQRRGLDRLLVDLKGRQKVYARLGRRGFTHSQAMTAIKAFN